MMPPVTISIEAQDIETRSLTTIHPVMLSRRRSISPEDEPLRPGGEKLYQFLSPSLPPGGMEFSGATPDMPMAYGLIRTSLLS
jgi:hypothetical protein